MPLLLYAVGSAARARPFHADFDRGIQQDRKVRPCIAMHPIRNTVYGFHRKAASAPLVSSTGVGKSIAYDPGTCLERGQNDVIDVKRARSKHQQKLRYFGNRFVAAVHQDVANILGEWRATGLARGQYIMASGFNAFDERLDIRRLTDPFDALNANKFATFHVSALPGDSF